MAGVSGPNSRHLQLPPPPPPPIWPLGSEDLAVFMLGRRLSGTSKFFEITSQRLLDQSQAGVYRGKRHIALILGLFGPIRVPYPKGLNC